MFKYSRRSSVQECQRSTSRRDRTAVNASGHQKTLQTPQNSALGDQYRTPEDTAAQCARGTKRHHGSCDLPIQVNSSGLHDFLFLLVFWNTLEHCLFEHLGHLYRQNIPKPTYIPTANIVFELRVDGGKQSSISSVLSPPHLCLALTHRLRVLELTNIDIFICPTQSCSLSGTMRQSVRRVGDTSASLFPLSPLSLAVSCLPSSNSYALLNVSSHVPPQSLNLHRPTMRRNIWCQNRTPSNQDVPWCLSMMNVTCKVYPVTFWDW